MTTINHECYVSLEVAKLLKEAGFDWKCKNLYDSQDNYNGITFTPSLKNWNVSNKLDYSAPTLEVVQRWLREEHYFHIFVEYDSWNYFCRIDQCEPVCLYKHREWIHNCKEFSTYEEAQEAGVKKALELILEKGE